MYVCLEAGLSGHSCEDKLRGLFHGKTGLFPLLPLAVPCWSSWLRTFSLFLIGLCTGKHKLTIARQLVGALWAATTNTRVLDKGRSSCLGNSSELEKGNVEK